MNNITDLGQYRQQKEAEQAADKMIDLAMALDVKYETKGLSMVLQACENVTYYSGDVDHHQTRRVSHQAGAQLLRAATIQRFEIVKLAAELWRLVFDGQYIYDLYLLPNLPASITDQLMAVLSAETKLNIMIAEKHSALFQMAMQQAMQPSAAPAQPQPAETAQPSQPAAKKASTPETLRRYQQAHQAGIAAAKQAAEDFKRKYPGDCGSCGGAVVLAALGKKPKLRRLLTEAGILDGDTWTLYGQKRWCIRFDYKIPGYNQQNAAYEEMPRRAYVQAMIAALPELADLLHVHSWSD